PLLLGSVKSNIGHSQAAAGVAGVIKMVLAMRHGIVPATLHVDAPSSHVEWESGAVELVTEARPWPRGERPRRAGVSSFGVSGTNAHVVVSEAPPRDPSPVAPTSAVGSPAEAFPAEPSPAEPSPAEPVAAGRAAPTGVRSADAAGTAGVAASVPVPFVLSGRTAAGLAGQAGKLAGFLRAGGAAIPDRDVALGLLARSSFDRRGVAIGRSREELLAGLDALASGSAPPGVALGVAGPSGGVGFVFSGQGAQRAGMGVRLAETFPVFREALAEVVDGFSGSVDPSVNEVMAGTAGDIDATAYTQPALFAFEVALARLLAELGVAPDVVMGHSVGELAAAHVAGVFDLPDGCRLVATRGRLMQAARPGGLMLAVGVSEAEMAAVLVGRAGVAIAAVNGPTSVVVSGDAEAIGRIERFWRSRRRMTRRLRVSHAFHSAHMDDVLDELAEVVRGIDLRRPSVPLVSNVSGALAGAEILEPGYWVRQVRAAVRFADGVTAAREAGVRRFVEIGPDAILAPLVRDTLDSARPAAASGTAGRGSAPAGRGPGGGALVVAAARRDRDEATSLVDTVGALYADGVPVDWSLLLGRRPRPADAVALPRYAFQRQRYWLDNDPAVSTTGARTDAAGARLPAGARLTDGVGAVAATAAGTGAAPAGPADVAGAAGTVPVEARGAPTEPAGAGQSEPARRLAGASDADRADLLLETVLVAVAQALGHADVAEVDPDVAFLDLGFSSLTIRELGTRLAETTGLTVPAEVIFDNPSSRSLADHLIGAESSTARWDAVAPVAGG
ncbi:type I polyketide synthase, partial [Pseudofrankia sp. BMG5.36]|uniref:acyltransferase domain-containing protein n=2 Tax=unclassified Pseudofrankia TaxID=2994372 RepID=UPI000AE720C4